MFGSSKFNTLLKHPGYNGGGGSSGSSKTVTEIPAELKPLASKYSEAGVNLFNTPFDYYDQQRFTPLNANQNSAISMVQQRAMNGSDTFDAADSALNSFYTQGPNPYLTQMFNQAAGDVMNNVNSNFALAGRTGSNSHAETYQKGLNNLAANMYGNAYAQDQANKLSAINMAPTFANQAYQDASQLMNVGQIQQDQAQQQLDFNYQQFLDEQNKTYNDMSAAAGVFQAQPYGSSSSTKSSGGGK